jgi:hypothetical protein
MIVDKEDADACEERRRSVQSSRTRVRPWPIFNARQSSGFTCTVKGRELGRAAGRPVSRDEPRERGDGDGTTRSASRSVRVMRITIKNEREPSGRQPSIRNSCAIDAAPQETTASSPPCA